MQRAKLVAVQTTWLDFISPFAISGLILLATAFSGIWIAIHALVVAAFLNLLC